MDIYGETAIHLSTIFCQSQAHGTKILQYYHLYFTHNHWQREKNYFHISISGVFFHVKSYYTHMYYIKPYGPNSVCTSPLKLFAPFSPTPIIAPGNFLKDQQILCLQNFTQISYNDITQKKKAAVIQKLLHLRHWRSLRWTYSLGDVQKCLLTANKCCTLIFLR